LCEDARFGLGEILHSVKNLPHDLELAVKEKGRTHTLVATPHTVHTRFLESAIPPVLTVDSGDTVVLTTLMLMDNSFGGE